MFVVVETIRQSDNKPEVQAVPTSFFNAERTTYHYPNKNKSVSYKTHAIQNCQVPDQQDWYEIHNFKIVCQDYGEYFYLCSLLSIEHNANNFFTPAKKYKIFI